MFKAKNDFSQAGYQGKCPVCGGEEFEWGRLSGQTYYAPGESMWRWRGYQYIRARRCVQCNHLLAFADPDLTKKQNRMAAVIVFVVLAFILLGVMLPILLTSLH